MKSAITFLIAYLLFHSPDSTVEKWIIAKDSSLRIEGRTNLNTFNCSVKKYLHADTLSFSKNNSTEKEYAVKGEIIINSNEFDCKKKYMNGDLKKTLKADISPYLSIKLMTISNFINTSQPVRGTVAISLAGVKKNIEVNYTVTKGTCGRLFLDGKCNVLFSDFGLNPPRKLSGLIKVNQEIDVSFLLILVKA